MKLSHVAWNLGGLALPLGVAVLTVPTLMERLGQERFGLLALAWGLIGYAGALDLGVGRALTQMVARLRGEGNVTSIPDALATASRITLITGLVGGALIMLFALAGGTTWLRVSSTDNNEVVYGTMLLAVALPAQAMSATYRGLNEAFMHFRGISLLRAALGVVNFGGPYWVSAWSTQLPYLVLTLVVSRLLALLMFRYLAVKCMDGNQARNNSPRYSKQIAKSLFSFGAWVTVSGIVSPLLVQADRFLIASVLSAAAVTVYVLPYEAVVQSLLLVGAVSSVMFPGLAKLMQEQPGHWRSYFRKWLLRVSVLMMVVCSVLALALPILLPLWLKSHLAADSIVIGQILCLGVFANSLGVMHYARIQALGRADVTAKLHLIELPIFIGALWFLLGKFGVTGAAWAWTGRMVFDAFALALYGHAK